MVRITVVHLMIWVAFIPARRRYADFRDTVNWLVAAAKLNANTNTGMTVHNDMSKLPGSGTCPKPSSFQCGISHTIKKPNAAMSGRSEERRVGKECRRG